MDADIIFDLLLAIILLLGLGGPMLVLFIASILGIGEIMERHQKNK